VRALQVKIQGFVECLPQQRYADGSVGAICYVNEGSILDPPVDLGAWLIEQGLAVAGPGAPFEYGVLEEIARTNGRGVWASRSTTSSDRDANAADEPTRRRAPVCGRAPLEPHAPRRFFSCARPARISMTKETNKQRSGSRGKN
jgi:hypothetical protein